MKLTTQSSGTSVQTLVSNFTSGASAPYFGCQGPIMPKHSVSELFYPTGELLTRMELIDDVPNGLLEQWHISGRLTLRAHLLNGVLHGQYDSWWDNGNLKESGEYKHDKKSGIYRWYQETGELWSEQDCGGVP